MLPKLRCRLRRFLLVVGSLVVVQLGVAGPAMACDPVDPFLMPIEHMIGPELNDPASQLALDYTEYHKWQYEGASLPDLIGGYETRTVRTLEPTDDWLRGSVTVVTRYWGEPPSNMGPFVVNPANIEGWEEPYGYAPECDGGPESGPPEGQVLVGAVFTDSDAAPPTLWGGPEEVAQALTEVFGEPTEVPRDLAAEQAIIDGFESTQRGGSDRPYLLVGLLGVLALGLAFLASRSRA